MVFIKAHDGLIYNIDSIINIRIAYVAAPDEWDEAYEEYLMHKDDYVYKGWSIIATINMVETADMKIMASYDDKQDAEDALESLFIWLKNVKEPFYELHSRKYYRVKNISKTI